MKDFGKHTLAAHMASHHSESVAEVENVTRCPNHRQMLVIKVVEVVRSVRMVQMKKFVAVIRLL